MSKKTATGNAFVMFINFLWQEKLEGKLILNNSMLTATGKIDFW